jgi:putative oxidoreductase
MNNKVTITLDLPAIGRLFIALVFLWAALSKLANPTEFLGALFAYQLPLPKLFLQFVAVVLPWFELLCGLLLLLNTWTESALVAAGLLLAVFIACTGQAWARGLHISCGCFNLQLLGLSHGHPLVDFLDSTAFAFLRNLVLGTLTVHLCRKHLAIAHQAAS